MSFTHQHAFAHHALRQVAFEHPALIFALLASDQRSRFFDDVLKTVDEHLLPGQVRTFTGSDVGFHGLLVSGRPCAILQMPLPGQPTEAYFVALVSHRTMEELQGPPVPDAAPPGLDYLTLEEGLAVEGEPATVLGEWDKGGTHLNHGPGPAPTLREFTAYLIQRVQGGSQT